MSRFRDVGGARAKGEAIRWKTPSGLTVLLEESHSLPLVDLQITLKTGCAHDPPGLEGLTRLTARLVRMGTRHMQPSEVEECIAKLGAQLSVEASTSYLRFSGSVLKRNVDAFIGLLAELLRAPAFRAGDFAQAKREAEADIIAVRDSDRALASRHFRRLLFPGHAYGRSTVGTKKSLRAMRRDAIRRHYEAHYVSSNMIVAAAGDISAEQLESLVDRHFSSFPKRKAPRDIVPAPTLLRGRRVRIVDKPQRTQTQILIGGLGIKVGDASYFPLLVANTVFGGTFTSRLMREVRSKRGWSYGASSRFEQDRQRDAWYMWTFPAATDAVACVDLQLRLLDDLVDKGLKKSELSFAKSYLTKSFAFDVDTAVKRLSHRVELELFDLPADFYERYTEYVRGVSLAEANEAIARKWSKRHLGIVVVATASDVKAGLADLPGVANVEVVPFDGD